MEITVRLFATLRDRAGASSVQVELVEPATVADLIKELTQKYPALEPSLPTVLVAVNQEYSAQDQPIKAGDEVALFPPVSGGSGENTYPEYFAVTPDRLDFDSILATITRPETGAVCVFSGAVRGSTVTSDQIRATSYLEYEAYIPMAEKTLQQVAQEIREQYPKVQGIAIVQRIGTLQVGETTIFVACAAGHRNDGCFEGARYGIDRVKEIVPVWKKEVGSDAEFWVEGGYLPTPVDGSESASKSRGKFQEVSRDADFVVGCKTCGGTYSLDAIPQVCTCGSLLDVLESPPFDITRIETNIMSMWRYRRFLLPDGIEPVTMGEGWTPLVPVHAFGRTIQLKMESANPSGAFKDRCASVLTSLLRSQGIQAVHDDSSGNAGAALAAYAARAGLKTTLYIPEDASSGKLGQIKVYGAQLIAIPGPRHEARIAAQQAASGTSYYASHIDHPFSVFAYKSIAFELFEQLGKRAPDSIVLPLGHGSQLLGLMCGFQDLMSADLIERLPRLYGIQAESCAPIHANVHGGDTAAQASSTIAEGIRVEKPVRIAQVVEAIRNSGGDVLTVREPEILDGIAEMGRRGFIVEPTTAVIWQGLAELSKRLPQDAIIIGSVTGSGLKTPDLAGIVEGTAIVAGTNGLHS